jgi:hypothetical protein
VAHARRCLTAPALLSCRHPEDNLRSAAESPIRSFKQRRFPDCANPFPVLLFKIPCSRENNSLFRCAGNFAVTLGICNQIRADCRDNASDSAKFPCFFPDNREFASQTGSPWTASSATQSGLRGVISPWGRIADIPAGYGGGSSLWSVIFGISVRAGRVLGAGLWSPFFNFRLAAAETGSIADRDRFAGDPWGVRRTPAGSPQLR